MIHRISQRWGESLARQLDRPQQTAILVYGMELFLGTLWELMALLILAFIFGVIKTTLLILLSSVLLRVVSGGFHSASYQRCFYITVGTYLLLSIGVSWVAQNITYQQMQYIIYTGLAFLMPVILLWVPTKNPHKTFEEPWRRVKFKVYSLAVIILWIIYYFWVKSSYPAPSPAVTNAFILLLGLLWQGFQVTPWGFQLFEKFDTFLSFFLKKGGELYEKS